MSGAYPRPPRPLFEVAICDLKKRRETIKGEKSDMPGWDEILRFNFLLRRGDAPPLTHP